MGINPELEEALNTPAMKQFVSVKKKYPDSIVFFRMGDFYEMFLEDAIIASAILDIALTKRQNHIPMCGIPYHATESYISRLLTAGKKIVVCEQIKNEDPTAKLMQREVVRVITPGTIVEENLLSGFENNFFAICYFTPLDTFIGFVDVSTAERFYFSFKKNQIEKIHSCLYRHLPREIVVLENHLEELDQLKWPINFTLTKINESLNENKRSGFDALSEIAEFIIKDNFKSSIKLKDPIVMEESSFLEIDENTVRNLDLVENQAEKDKSRSLFGVLNKCSTNPGKRFLRTRILYPYRSITTIGEIWKGIEKFKESRKLKNEIRSLLSETSDLERIISRFRTGKGLPRDFRTILKNIEIARNIYNLLQPEGYSFVLPSSDLDPIYDYILERLHEGELPPILGGDGYFIRSGFNEKLDRAREAKTKGKDWILELEEKEKKKLGLTTFKIKYNKVVGYFVELSRKDSALAPSSYLKKQTLVTTERFTFPELEEVERNILESDEIIEEIEKKEFELMAQKLSSSFPAFSVLSSSISFLDYIVSLTICAEEFNWVLPKLNNNGNLIIADGRHPVVEAHLPVGENFVPNSIELGTEENSIAVLTGPNMAGKSTFMRQVAIAQILFQMGSYLPAKSAGLSIADKLFTRIGSGDNLTKGESTFFMEMKETAFILANRTEKSLILFDEIGRGTSTYDGLSIAWAIIEYLSKNRMNEKFTKTIFATHYHELTDLEKESGVFNLYMDTVEKEGEVVFLRKVKKGRSKRSFGVYVAKIAGIPIEVVNRASELLYLLESKRKEIKVQREEQFLFSFNSVDNSKENEVIEKIKSISIENLTPMEALKTLDEIKKMIK